MSLSLLEMFEHMGMVAWAVVVILFLMSIILIAISIERWILFSGNNKRSIQIVVAIRRIFEEHGSEALDNLGEMGIKRIIDEKYANASEKAREKAAGKYRRVPLAMVIEAASRAIRGRTKNLDALDLVVGVNRAVERTIERQTSLLKKGFGSLATIATTAPFIGLFGTVVGIINAFGSIEQTKGLEGVAGGISEALVATAIGLAVAIPAVGLYNYFSNAVDKIVVDMDEVASEIVEAVVLQNKKG